MCYTLLQTKSFREWIQSQPPRVRALVDKRLALIKDHGYFGTYKPVTRDNTVWELKWNNGLRVYYAYLPEKNILLLLGGNKNGQNKDISEAKNIFFKNTEKVN